jgi:hypothetical protein
MKKKRKKKRKVWGREEVFKCFRGGTLVLSERADRLT